MRIALVQQIATDDIAHVMRHLGMARAHVVGLSMGANAALQLGDKDLRMMERLVRRQTSRRESEAVLI